MTDVLLKMLNGDEYVTIAGMRIKSMIINGGQFEPTAHALGHWKDRLMVEPISELRFSGSGVFKDMRSVQRLHNNNSHRNVLPLMVVVPNLGSLKGVFSVVSYVENTNGPDITFEVEFDSEECRYDGYKEISPPTKRKIVIETCQTCPNRDHKGGFGQIAYIPVCRLSGKELPHTTSAQGNRIVATGSDIIPDWCELEKDE